MKADNNKLPIIIVLGMHRSGTSLVAQLVAKWGAFMGNDLMPADEFNIDGYWEHNPLVALNEKIFEFLGHNWIYPPETMHIDSLIDQFGEEANQIVNDMDSQNTLWCWKDPRIVFLLPFWKRILAHRKIAYIVSYRNPFAVASSLKKRDDLPESVAFALWENTMLRILKEIDSYNYQFLVEYEKLLTEPDEFCSSLFYFLNRFNGVEKNNEVLLLMQQAIKPNLSNSVIINTINPTQKLILDLLEGGKTINEVENSISKQIFQANEILKYYSTSYLSNHFFAQCYIQTKSNSFNESNSKKFPVSKGIQSFEIDLSKYKDITDLRFDPLNHWVALKVNSILLFTNQNDYLIENYNPNHVYYQNEILFFNSKDPQITIDLTAYSSKSIKRLTIIIDYLALGEMAMIEFGKLSNQLFENITDKSSYILKNKIFSLDRVQNHLTLLPQQDLPPLEQNVPSPHLDTNSNFIPKSVHEAVLSELTQKEKNEELYLDIIRQKEYEISSKSLEINQLSLDLISKDDEIKKAMELIIELAEEIEHKDQSIDELILTGSTLKTELESLQTEEHKLKNWLSELKIQITEKNVLISEQTELIAEQNKQISSFPDILNSIISDYKENQSALSQIKSEFEEQKSHLKLDQELITEQDGRIKDLIKKNDQLVIQNKSLESNNIQMHKDLQEIKSENQAIQKSFTYKLAKIFRSIFLIFHPIQLLKMLNLKLNLKKHLSLITQSQLFDEEFYLKSNPDVAASGMNPAKHYLLFGGFEERNPSVNFDSEFYLRTNPDILPSKINPLIHFLKFGQSEGRSPLPPEVQQNSVTMLQAAGQVDLDKIRIIEESQQFDKSFYLNTYPDVKAAGIDPVFHYHFNGWRENRDPNPYFKTSYYLTSNPDVVEAGIDPYYHYLVAGKAEGRLPSHPCGHQVEHLKNNYRLKNQTGIIIDLAPELCHPEEMISVLGNIISASTKGLIISISHDNYRENVGGIQLCLIEEEQHFISGQMVYIHLSPVTPFSFFHTSSSENLLRVLVNGEKIFYFHTTQFVPLIKKIHASLPTYLIIHSVLGHDQNSILNLSQQITYKRKFFWIHDFLSICANFNLMRNNIAFCDAPELSSNSCQLCLFGEKRQESNGFFTQLFSDHTFEIISPSQYALNYFNKKSTYPIVATHVLQHRTITNKLKTVKRNIKKGLKIGFVGYPAYHKGWNDFEKLVSRFGTDKRYQFFHIGLHPTNNSKITFIESKVSPNHPDQMIDTLSKAGLDFCFVWPKWNETFCLTAFESIVAGAMILTHTNSGNVYDLLQSDLFGISFESFEQLIDAFETGYLHQYINERTLSGRVTYEFSKSKMTYSLINYDN